MWFFKLARLGHTLTWTLTSMLTLAACAPQQSPPAPLAPYFSTTDISFDSPADGWAVGRWITSDSTPTNEPAFRFAMAHFQHGQWRLAPASVTGDHEYLLVQMLSATDGWAATRGDIQHYDGVRWRAVFPSASEPRSSVVIRGFAFLSPTDGWAVGDNGILHLTQGVWRDTTATLPPRPADWLPTWNYPGLRSVAVVSATDAWAVGEGGVIWHYDGAQWRIVEGPYFPNSIFPAGMTSTVASDPNRLLSANVATHTDGALFSVQMISGSEGWSVGGPLADNLHGDPGWGPATVERYQAGVWQIAHIATGHVGALSGTPLFISVAMASPQEGWIGGAWAHLGFATYGDAPGPMPKVYTPLLLHYQAGEWTFVSAPPTAGAIHKIAMTSADEGWAAADGGLLHFTDGHWQLTPVRSAS